MNYIPPTRIGVRVGHNAIKVPALCPTLESNASVGIHVGYAKPFRYEHVDTSKAKSSKPMQGPNAKEFAFWWNIDFTLLCACSPDVPGPSVIRYWLIVGFVPHTLSDTTRSIVVIWVNFFQTELMVKIPSKSLVGAIGKVLLMKFS